MTINEGQKQATIPQTGKIGRFIKLLKTNATEKSFYSIIKDCDKYNSFKPFEKSLWWKKTVAQMESELGTDQAIQVMRGCGAKCCGKGQRKTGRRLMMESGSLEKFLDKISKHGVKDGELTYTLKNRKTIIAEHNRCFCKQIAHAKEHFNNATYCQCSVEFNKQFFMAALEQEVEVELVQSIACGDKSCKFRITLSQAC